MFDKIRRDFNELLVQYMRVISLKKGVMMQDAEGGLYRNGMTDSPFLIAKYDGRADTSLTYGLKPNCTASKALDDLLENDRKLVIACQLARILAAYLSILALFKQYRGTDRGSALFDHCFRELELQDYDLCGTDIRYKGNPSRDKENAVNVHRLSYFFVLLSISQTDIRCGDWLYFDNDPGYSKRHPAGTSRRVATVAIKKEALGCPLFISFPGGEKKSSEEMNKQLVQAYNSLPSKRSEELISALKKQSEGLDQKIASDSVLDDRTKSLCLEQSSEASLEERIKSDPQIRSRIKELSLEAEKELTAQYDPGTAKLVLDQTQVAPNSQITAVPGINLDHCLRVRGDFLACLFLDPEKISYLLQDWRAAQTEEIAVFDACPKLEQIKNGEEGADFVNILYKRGKGHKAQLMTALKTSSSAAVVRGLSMQTLYYFAAAFRATAAFEETASLRYRSYLGQNMAICYKILGMAYLWDDRAGVALHHFYQAVDVLEQVLGQGGAKLKQHRTYQQCVKGIQKVLTVFSPSLGAALSDASSAEPPLEQSSSHQSHLSPHM